MVVFQFIFEGMGLNVIMKLHSIQFSMAKWVTITVTTDQWQWRLLAIFRGRPLTSLRGVAVANESLFLC